MRDIKNKKARKCMQTIKGLCTTYGTNSKAGYTASEKDPDVQEFAAIIKRCFNNETSDDIVKVKPLFDTMVNEIKNKMGDNFHFIENRLNKVWEFYEDNNRTFDEELYII